MEVRAKDKKISRGTVYLNLAILAESNDIMNVKVLAADLYDLRTNRHYHIYCVERRKVFGAPLNYNTEYDEQENRILSIIHGLEFIPDTANKLPKKIFTSFI